MVTKSNLVVVWGGREGCFLMSTKLVMRICPPTPLFAKEVGGRDKTRFAIRKG
jgi:hypothetical protein